jgi:hypothetical protein
VSNGARLRRLEEKLFMGVPTHIVWHEYNENQESALVRYMARTGKEVGIADKIHYIGFDAPMAEGRAFSDIEITPTIRKPRKDT